MMESIIIGFANPTDDRQPVTLIMLEQEGYLPYTGYVTKLAMVTYISNMIYHKTDAVKINCGMEDGILVVPISAYPYYPDLNYKLLASYGSLSEPVIDMAEKNETIQLKLEDTVTVKYPVHEVISAEWLNGAYDEELSLISPPPTITIGPDAKSISISTPCYGSVAVKYTSVVHEYMLTIPKRVDTNENKYSAVVYAVYDGGLVYLVISPPQDADDTDGDCGKGGDTVDQNPDHPKKKKPEGDGADRLIQVNYCTQKVMTDFLIY